MDEQYKIVYFHLYCPTCKHELDKDTDEPCNECLSTPGNANSHKPVNWEEK